MSIKKLGNMVNTTKPYAWDDSMSVYEYLGKIMNWLNQLDKRIPDDFETAFYERFREYTRDEMQRVIDSGEFAAILDSMVLEFGTKIGKVEGQLAQTMKVVNVNEQFGAIGDGVADDTEPLINAFQYATENNIYNIVFDGKYLYTSHILVDGFKELNIIGNGSTFIDNGRLLDTNDGMKKRNPVGISFEDFKELTINNIELYTNDMEGSDGSRLVNQSEAHPVLSIDSGDRKGNTTIDGLLLNGKTGTYVYQTEMATLKSAFNGSFVRVTDCNNVKFSNVKLNEYTVGGGEIFCIGDCNYLHFSKYHYHRLGTTTPHSHFKFIRVDRQLIEQLYSHNHGNAADFADLSAKDWIVIRDSYVNHPSGDRFEITSEWGPFNIDIGDVYIKNISGLCRSFNQTQVPQNEEYDNTIKSMTIEDCEISAVYIASNYYTQKTIFRNCTIKILDNISGQSQIGIRTYGYTVFDGCTILPNSEHMARIHVRADQRHIDGHGVLIIKDCDIKQLVLWTQKTDGSSNIDVTFTNTNIQYTHVTPVFLGVRLAIPINSLKFDRCKINGGIGKFTKYIDDATAQQNAIKKLTITDCEIDLVTDSDTYAWLVTIDNNRFLERANYTIKNNIFGQSSLVGGFQYSTASKPNDGGCLLTMENNVFNTRGNTTWYMINTSGYLDAVDYIFKNNVFNGTLSSTRIEQLGNDCRNFLNEGNVELGLEGFNTIE